jgi:hypothetical protein
MAVPLSRLATALGLWAALSGALAGSAAAQPGGAPPPPREPIATDRPDFTDAPDVVAPRTVQLEAGDTYGRAGGERSNAIGELLFRIGVSRRLELRLEPGSYRRSDEGGGGPGHGAHWGWDDAAVGFKLALREAPPEGEGGHAPALGLEARTTLPVGTVSAAEPEAKLAASWELGKRWSVGTNLDYALRAGAEGGRIGEVAATASFERELGARLHGFAEGYAIHPAGAAGTQFVDTGLTLLLGPDAQLDARVGSGVGGNRRDYFVGVGLARRW